MRDKKIFYLNYILFFKHSFKNICLKKTDKQQNFNNKFFKRKLLKRFGRRVKDG